MDWFLYDIGLRHERVNQFRLENLVYELISFRQFSLLTKFV